MNEQYSRCTRRSYLVIIGRLLSPELGPRNGFGEKLGGQRIATMGKLLHRRRRQHLPWRVRGERWWDGVWGRGGSWGVEIETEKNINAGRIVDNRSTDKVISCSYHNLAPISH